ncbi:MAG: AraC family transcriptional regulator [Lachnospiraceae bacterium]|nr:AraC family transcriptional regulator [Acetatifactor muris]MCM1218592.1 AraC family transcriptional regulator [Lachnospiraceae bacterium]
MEIAQKLELFQELLSCVGEISLWHLDPEMELISTNNRNPDLFSIAFAIGGCKEAVRTYFHENRMPVIISSGISLSWLAAPHFVQDILVDTYLIGPVFTSVVSEDYLCRRIQEYHFPKEWEMLAVQNMDTVPVVSYQTLMQYGVMLYYCISCQKILPEAIGFVNRPNLSAKQPDTQRRFGELEYLFQLEIMQAVEDGNVDYVHPRKIYSLAVGTMSKEGPLRQAKNLMITFITEITRAAIRGGMSPTDAFNLSDFYILISEECTNEAEVYQNGQTCLRDFTRRVHGIRQNGYSKVVQDCLDYIVRNVHNRITMDDLSAALNYNKNYLSTKVHEETGLTIRSIITQEKLKQAALLLTGSARSIQDICHELGFDSPSYFTMQFRKAYGVTPKEYRACQGFPPEDRQDPNALPGAEAETIP